MTKRIVKSSKASKSKSSSKKVKTPIRKSAKSSKAKTPTRGSKNSKASKTSSHKKVESKSKWAKPVSKTITTFKEQPDYFVMNEKYKH